MRHPHVTSGGRYPALRTIAVLHLIGALCVIGICAWQAIRVAMYGQNGMTEFLFGHNESAGGRAIAVVCWLAVGFIGAIGLLAIAELIKLFIDIEHNTRTAHLGAAAATNGVVIDEGPAVPFVPSRKLFEGDETAEGALLRGH